MLGTYTKRASVLLILVVFFEMFLSRYLEIFGARPDFLLIFIVFWAFAVDRRSVLPLAIFLGLIRDIFATGFFGAETASYFLVACLVSGASLKVERENFWIQGGLAFLLSWVRFCFYALIVMIQDESRSFAGNFWWLAFFHSVYTAICAACLIGLFERWVWARPLTPSPLPRWGRG